MNPDTINPIDPTRPSDQTEPATPERWAEAHEGALAELLSSTDVTFMTDGGLETTLVFLHDLDLPEFAAFPLLTTEDGRQSLRSYYRPYLEIAEARGLGMVLDTPTWRANPDWAQLLGYDRAALRAVNTDAAVFVRELAAEQPGLTTVINGAIGPRGDGYVVGEAMGSLEAAAYHALQIGALADGGADMITAVTMTYVDEAIGVASAAASIGLPATIGFTVETDGRLPSGEPLRAAISAVDAATGGSPVGYMVNCAHPSHFEHVLVDSDGEDAQGGGGWTDRIRVIRANASRMSHAELDEAPELDRGDLDELAGDYQRLREVLPNLTVVGGCCGTDHEHLDRITRTIR